MPVKDSLNSVAELYGREDWERIFPREKKRTGNTPCFRGIF